MADLIAIGYPDETTAASAAREAERRADDLELETDAIATLVRDKEGIYRVSTRHQMVGADAPWGMFWSLLFGLLFFVPVFGMAVGAGLAALMAEVDKAVVDDRFRAQVRDMLQPGTSALFLVVSNGNPDRVVDALGQYGGIVLVSSLSKDAEAQLRKALHGGALSR